MAPSYCTAGRVRQVLPTQMTTAHDSALTVLAAAASRAIDNLHGREAGAYAVSTASTRYFNGSGERKQWVGEMADAPSAVAVAESGDVDGSGVYTTWAAKDYLLWPYNAPEQGLPYLRLDVDTLNGSKIKWFAYPKAVKITAKFGFSTAAPAEIVQAAVIQTARWWKRGQQVYQDTGSISQLGQLTYTKKLDPDVATLLDVPKFNKVASYSYG